MHNILTELILSKAVKNSFSLILKMKMIINEDDYKVDQ